MREHRAKTKDGRAWIAAILASTDRVTKVEINNITDERVVTRNYPLDLVKKFVAIDERTAVLYEIGDREFVYLTGGSSAYVTKYVLNTYAFDHSDLSIA